jgi:ubiquinone/menaquinone biosynthesis C-methylase UbiE
MRRVPSRELLDDDTGTPAEVAGSLADIHFLNTYFGGLRTSTGMFLRVARASGRSEFSVLDVGAGSGDLSRSLRNKLKRRNIDLRFTLLDRCASHLGSEENSVVGDALALPFPENQFDFITCCLFVHHLSPEEVAVFVKEALRCCRLALLINDLVRNPVHLAFARAGSLIYRSPLTRNDAPASVRQAYTVSEMREMLKQSGALNIEIMRRYFYRMGVIVWKDPLALNGKVGGHV